jgi:hypothetical protein
MTAIDDKQPGNSHVSLTVHGSEFGMSSASMNGTMTDSVPRGLFVTALQ